MTKLTREQWDAMTPDEQWRHVNQSPYQIGEIVQVHPFEHHGFMMGGLSFTGRIVDANSYHGRWFFSITEVNPTNPDNPHYVSGWPETGVSEVSRA